MTDNDLGTRVRAWVSDLQTFLAGDGKVRLADLFTEQASARDSGGLTWDFHQYHGLEAVEGYLADAGRNVKPTNFRISETWPQPHVVEGQEPPSVEFFFDFDVLGGQALGTVLAAPDESAPHGLRAFALYTRIEGVAGVPEVEPHPRGYGFTPVAKGETWLDARSRRHAFTDAPPEVLVVGAGQAGLMTAAYLRRLGVSTLVIDKHERVGDNWRKRYSSLNLHNRIEMNHFPFLEFPEHFPEYLPKDMLGNWLELYANYLDLDVWTGTDFVGGDWDEAAATWTATLQGADGSRFELHPKHIVLATGGIGGKPFVPDIDGLPDFSGEVVHSCEFEHGGRYSGKRVLVVGTGSSGHDISRELTEHGAQVTMLQRSPVVVNNVDTANEVYAAGYAPGVPIELGDLRYGLALIYPLRVAFSQQAHQVGKQQDKELHLGLEKAGMVLGDGYEGAGWLDLFLRTGGGYYLNCGASELIIDGSIKVLQTNDVATLEARGARLNDGSLREFDAIVLATGYQNRSVEVAEQFGAEVADRIGPIARLDAEGEWANMWSQTAQRGLWFTGGGIPQARPGSKVLALLVKADIEGLIPDAMRRREQPSSAG